MLERFDGVEIGVHLHSRPDDAAAKVLAAYDAGCRRFDSAIGGLGGCPFAQDVLVGNIPTEKLLEALKSRGAELPVPQADYRSHYVWRCEIGEPVQRAENVREAAVRFSLFATWLLAISC